MQNQMKRKLEILTQLMNGMQEVSSCRRLSSAAPDVQNWRRLSQLVPSKNLKTANLNLLAEIALYPCAGKPWRPYGSVE